MRVLRGNLQVWAAVTVVLAATNPARAFYWAEWPGSQIRVQQTLITPPAVTPGNPPSPGHEPIPPVGPPIPVAKPPVGPPSPTSTPEPATGLLGLLGLGALASRRWWKQKQK